MVRDATERRLAAILHADVSGYSLLMSENEDAAVRAATAYREQIELLVRQYRGRLVDFRGDEFLAEFPSATDAVRCAVEIQRVLWARNAGVDAELRMEFRIGVHLGELRIEGERVFGDGVNIASRLQRLAEAGGICISGAVYDQLGRKLDLEYEDLGQQTVKNIPAPVRAYRVGALAALESPRAEQPDSPGPPVASDPVERRPGLFGRNSTEPPRPDIAAYAARDGTATLMFTDITGFSAATERLGDERGWQILRAYKAIIRDQLARQGGHEIDSPGDSFLIAFDSARRALLCAISTQRAVATYAEENPDAALGHSIGLHTGDVIAEEGKVFGRNVHLAARISSRAKGGEILISSIVKELTERADDFHYREMPEQHLPGMSQPLLLFEVKWD